LEFFKFIARIALAASRSRLEMGNLLLAKTYGYKMGSCLLEGRNYSRIKTLLFCLDCVAKLKIVRTEMTLKSIRNSTEHVAVLSLKSPYFQTTILWDYLQKQNNFSDQHDNNN